MPRTIFVFTILISLLIAGCGQSVTPEPLNTPALEQTKSTPPVPDGEWTINMNHSGGIMGLSRSIEISSDGKYTVFDERENKTITGELSSNELSKLNELITTSKYIPASKPDGMGCADCFLYDLDIQVNGEKFAAQLNDISLPNSGLESLVGYLRGLMDAALKS